MSGKSTKKIRKGDTVVAIAGNSRGQKGLVLASRGDKVVVQGLNVKKKHVKRSQTNPEGGVMTFEAPIHVSNVKISVENDQAVKLKVRKTAEGQREYVYRVGDEEKVYRAVKKTKS